MTREEDDTLPFGVPIVRKVVLIDDDKYRIAVEVHPDDKRSREQIARDIVERIIEQCL